MTFLALTGSPILESGVILNVMATPQRPGISPDRLGLGETVCIRFGHCCPHMAEGTITATAVDHVVLTLDAKPWVLEPGPSGSGIQVPGIVSDDWIVR